MDGDALLVGLAGAAVGASAFAVGKRLRRARRALEPTAIRYLDPIFRSP